MAILSDILQRAQAVMAAETHAIETAARELGKDFESAVGMLLHCSGRICTTGIGKAGVIAQKVQATLSSTGSPAYFLDPLNALHGDLGMVSAADVVVAFSKSGGPEISDLLEILHSSDCRVILVTANRDSKAAQLADSLLYIGDAPEACPLGLSPSASTTAMLALGDALALTVMDQKRIRPQDYAQWHPGGTLGRALMCVEQIMRTGADCPAVNPQALLSDCYEAASSAPKRAGAVLVSSESGKLLGIVTHGDIFRAVLHQGKTPASPVAEVMTRSPKRVHVGESLMSAFELMKRHAIDELPVVDEDEKLAGLLDIQDLLALGFS
jgi:arabinose-5-phosphate isomerase